jgi:fructose-1,6-bisphosphatase/inositol monophosphatase family enzyme
VLPELGSHAGRESAGAGAGGDVTFASDEAAERRVEEFVAERAPDVAFDSEDRGLVSLDPAPTMADVVAGSIVEIKSGLEFLAERGAGVEPAPRLSANDDVARLFWTYGFRGRPAAATAEVLAGLIDASSVTGATFDLGSATFDMTRILTGQLDAYVEPGPRIVEEVDGMRAEFERVGRGAVLNNSPYDLAAAALCLAEGGAVVSDARGRPLSDRPLLGSGAEFQMSCVAAANPVIHGKILEQLDAGIERLRASRA